MTQIIDSSVFKVNGPSMGRKSVQFTKGDDGIPQQLVLKGELYCYGGQIANSIKLGRKMYKMVEIRTRKVVWVSDDGKHILVE